MTGTGIAGDYGAAFLDIGVGARALGMGGAFCSLANDGTAFYWNPAGLSMVREIQISGMYGPQFGSIRNPLGNYHFLGYTQPLPGSAVIAFQWIRLAVDEIPVYSGLEGENYWDRFYNSSLRPTGEPEGYINDTEDAFFFSFALMNRWDLDLGWDFHRVGVEIPIGVNLKWIRQELGDGEASGLGLDVGTMVRIHMDDFFQLDRLGIFSVGVHLQDVTTTKISWNTKHQDAVPLNVKWGVSYQHPLPMGNSSLAVAYNRDSRYRGKNRWGLEYTGFGVLGLRVGLDDGRFTGGIGFRVWILQVDYAFVSHELDALHRISCSVTL